MIHRDRQRMGDGIVTGRHDYYIVRDDARLYYRRWTKQYNENNRFSWLFGFLSEDAMSINNCNRIWKYSL